LHKRIKVFNNIFENPFDELSTVAKEVMKAISAPQPTRWEYVIDSTTGLKILKSEKDSEALDHVRKMADELFK
jgi:hypothetical protein